MVSSRTETLHTHKWFALNCLSSASMNALIPYQRSESSHYNIAWVSYAGDSYYGFINGQKPMLRFPFYFTLHYIYSTSPILIKSIFMDVL